MIQLAYDENLASSWTALVTASTWILRIGALLLIAGVKVKRPPWLPPEPRRLLARDPAAANIKAGTAMIYRNESISSSGYGLHHQCCCGPKLRGGRLIRRVAPAAGHNVPVKKL